MEKSAIVLAGGSSRRLGEDKGLIMLADKPLILHIIDRISTVVDEVTIVVGSHAQKTNYTQILKPDVKIIVDKYETRSPLVGALTGFESTHCEYSLLLPCDTPFVSRQIAFLLLELCVGKDAVIPRWPNGYLEPLQAAYQTKSALTATRRALEDKRSDLRSMIFHLRKILYLSTLVLKQMDSRLLTFSNVNTLEDLRRVEHVFKNASMKGQNGQNAASIFRMNKDEKTILLG